MDESRLEENRSKRAKRASGVATLPRRRKVINTKWATILTIVVALLVAFQIVRIRFPLPVFIVGFLMAVPNKKPAKRVSLPKYMPKKAEIEGGNRNESGHKLRKGLRKRKLLCYC